MFTIVGGLVITIVRYTDGSRTCPLCLYILDRLLFTKNSLSGVSRGRESSEGEGVPDG